MTLRQALLAVPCFLLVHLPAWAETAEHGAETSVDPLATHDAAVDAAHGAADAAHGAAAAHGAEGGGGLPQFDPSTFASQIFWLVIAFGVLYVFSARKAVPEIGAVLKKREQHIRSTLDAAKRQKEVAEGLQQEYEGDIERARQEAMSAFVEAEKAIKKSTEEATKSFQKRASDRVDQTEAEIEKAKAAAVEDIHALAAEIASRAAEKIIGIETDLDHAKTVIRSLKAKAA